MSDDVKMVVDTETTWEERFEKARNYLEEGDTESALTILGKMYQEAPEERGVRTLLAMALSRAERWIDAEALYLKLIEDYPEDILLRVRLATLYIQLERNIEAKEWLEATLKMEPEAEEIHRILAMIYLRLGEYAQAKKAIDKADDEDLRNLLLLVLEEEGIQEEELLKELEEDSTEVEEDKEVAEEEEEKLTSDHELDEVSEEEEVEEEEEVDDSPAVSVREELDISLGSHELDLPYQEEEEEEEEPPQKAKESTNGALSVVVIPPSDPGVSERDSGDYVGEDFPFLVSQDSAKDKGAFPLGLSRGEDLTPLWIDLPQLFKETEKEFVLLNDGRLLVQLAEHERAFLRLRDLVMLSGSPELNIESKRFQGKPIEQTFGPRRNPMVRVEGHCQVLLQAQKEGYRSSVVLGGEEIAYFREGSVLAFSSGIDWENGRVPSSLKGFEDLSLDQFWGEGEIILESQGPIWGIPSKEGQRIRVEHGSLVGWVGSLIPSIVSGETISSSVKSKVFIDFEGEGGVLISS